MSYREYDKDIFDVVARLEQEIRDLKRRVSAAERKANTPQR